MDVQVSLLRANVEVVALLAPLLVVIAALAGLIGATMTGDRVRQQRLCAWVRWLVLGYGALAFVVAMLHWLLHPDWVHLLWTSTYPQIAMFVGAGAFLARDEWCRRAGTTRFGRGPWIMLAVLLAFALLPAALIQWAPHPPGAAQLGPADQRNCENCARLQLSRHRTSGPTGPAGRGGLGLKLTASESGRRPTAQE